MARALARRATPALIDADGRGGGRARDRARSRSCAAGATGSARRPAARAAGAARRRRATSAPPSTSRGSRAASGRRRRRAGRDRRRARRRASPCCRPTPSTSAPRPRADRASARAWLDAEIARAEGKLANQGFVAKAPEPVVAGRARQARARCSEERDGAVTLVRARRGAEEHLLGLELFGMRFGLERMRRLLTALGLAAGALRARSTSSARTARPRRSRMTAAMLEAHGAAHRRVPLAAPRRRSPSASAIGDADLEPDALRRRRRSARPRPPRRSTAALARRRPRHAVRAAHRRRVRRARAARGRGRGRRGRASAGATTPPNVLRAPVVGAHERRPGAHALARADDRRHRAREARRRARPARRSCSATADARGRARSPQRRRGARIVRAGRRVDGARCRGLPATQLRGGLRGGARALLGALDRRGRRRVAARITVPGPLRRSSASAPLTILDGAHNPSGIAALAAALPRVRGRARRGVVSILDDKDAAAMLRALLPRCAERRLHRGAQPARAAAGDAGVARARSSAGRRPRSSPEPRARARAGPRARRARTAPSSRPARSTSIADLVSRAGRRGGPRRCERRRPERPADDRARRGRRGARRSWSSSRSATLSGGCSSKRPDAARYAFLPRTMLHLRRLRHRQRRAQHGRQRPDPRARSSSGSRSSSGRSPTPGAASTTRCWWAARRSRRCSRSSGTIVYMIVRPPEYLDDVRVRELEMQAAEARLRAARLPAVPALRVRGQGRLPALPELHAQAQGPLHVLRQAARPRVAAVPVLRGRDRRRAAAPPRAAAGGGARASGRGRPSPSRRPRASR